MLMNPKFQKIAALVLIAVSVALFIVGLLTLPETLVMQVSSSGEAQTRMPRLLGLLLPLLLGVGFACGYMKTQNPKCLIGSLVGVLTYILTFVFNL